MRTLLAVGVLSIALAACGGSDKPSAPAISADPTLTPEYEAAVHDAIRDIATLNARVATLNLWASTQMAGRGTIRTLFEACADVDLFGFDRRSGVWPSDYAALNERFAALCMVANNDLVVSDPAQLLGFAMVVHDDFAPLLAPVKFDGQAEITQKVTTRARQINHP